jgi:hypothetical protein
MLNLPGTAFPTSYPPPKKRHLPNLYRLLHKTFVIRLLMRPAVAVECPMTTVSELIDDHNLK